MPRASSGRNQVQFGVPDRTKQASSRAARGRLCDHEGCETVLTTYNASSTCWLHTNASYRHPLSRG